MVLSVSPVKAAFGTLKQDADTGHLGSSPFLKFLANYFRVRIWLSANWMTSNTSSECVRSDMRSDSKSGPFLKRWQFFWGGLKNQGKEIGKIWLDFGYGLYFSTTLYSIIFG